MPRKGNAPSPVRESARANMVMYLLLKERAQTFRADPEAQQALAAVRVELAEPTLGLGESDAELTADATAYEDFDPSPYFNGRGFGFVRLQRRSTPHSPSSLSSSHGCLVQTRFAGVVALNAVPSWRQWSTRGFSKMTPEEPRGEKDYDAGQNGESLNYRDIS